MKTILAALAMLALCVPEVEARGAPIVTPGVANGLAQTPPMGWNSWNAFHCDVDEAKVRGAADAIVATGMKDAGYTYVVVDDCWQSSRDVHGDIVADAARFPSGMKALADYIHAKGLKFGLYSDAGEKTCGGRPGSRGHEFQDAIRYAEWGVDYLKYDWCNTGQEAANEGVYASRQNPVASYLLMSQALQATGRPIVFSICEWGDNEPWLWATKIGNLWRSSGDIADLWTGHPHQWDNGVLDILDMQVGLSPYSGPGHWNDPDMLEVGNGGMSDVEYRAHFSLWAMLAAPLIAGNDLAKMTEATKTILLNREVLAVDQDPLGKQADRVWKQGDLEVWARPLSGGRRAVALLNRGTAAAPITVTWESLDYPPSLTARVRDLWTKKDLRAKGAFTASVQPHGVVMATITP